MAVEVCFEDRWLEVTFVTNSTGVGSHLEVLSQVNLELGSLGVLAGTLVTVEQLHWVVQSAMASKVTPTFELFAADATFVRGFSTVHALVFLQLSGQGELLEAYGASKGSFSGMSSKVGFQLVRSFETFETQFTLEGTFSRMTSFVDLQVPTGVATTANVTR